VVKRRIVFVAAAASVLVLAACSAIIGTRDLTLESGSDGGPGTPDASGLNKNDANGISGDDDSGAVDGAQAGDAGTVDGGCGGANLQTDAKNCGTCGHDCGGGACSAGVCQAWTIVAGQFGGAEIAVDATHLYWTSVGNTQVLRAALDGTGLTALVTDPNIYPEAIALDDTNVYWVDDSETGSVQTCPKTGCGDAGARLVTSATLDDPTGLTVDGKNVYWAETETGGIGRASKLDGGAYTYVVTNLDNGWAVVDDDASVYFSSSDLVGSIGKTGIGAPTADGDAGPFKTIFNAANPIFSVALDQTNIYWAQDNDPGVVQFCPKTGLGGAGVPMTLAGTEHDPWEVAVDDANVYWTAQGPNSTPTGNDGYPTFTDGYVAMCPKLGCPSTGPVMLATGLHNPRGITVDATAVYFTIFGNTSDQNPNPVEGSVMKVMK
jgi:hypothetical protein